MPLISFKNLGAYGLITDMAPGELPLEAWSYAKNVKFTQYGVEPTLGNVAIGGTPSVEPLQAFSAVIGSDTVWSYWGEEKAYSTDGTTQYEITRAASNYSTDLDRKWNGGNFNGIVIANNGVDVPQAWEPTGYSTKAIDLPNWPATLTCAVLRPLGNFLVALALTDSTVYKPTALRWSHPADPGDVPVSWDITDATKDAGEWYLNETPGELTDLIPLQGDGLLYKSDSIYRMQYVGGVYIFKFPKVAAFVGMPTPNCAVEVRPGTHIFWSGDDILMTDGQTFKSVIDGKCRQKIQGIADTVYRSVSMVYNPQRSEIWLCWSENESVPRLATTALVLNWVTGAWGIRELGTSGFNFITTGVVDPSAGTAETWASVTGTWADDTARWNESATSRSTLRLLGGTQTQLTYEDTGYTLFGSTYESVVERIAFGIPFKQNQPPDISSWKFCREIWPRMSGETGTEIEVTIGSMQEISDTVTWEAPQTFVIGQDTKVNCTCSGRLFALRFKSAAAARWVLHGYDLEVNFAGSF